MYEKDKNVRGFPWPQYAAPPPPSTSCLTTSKMMFGYSGGFHLLVILNNLLLYQCASSHSCYCDKRSDRNHLEWAFPLVSSRVQCCLVRRTVAEHPSAEAQGSLLTSRWIRRQRNGSPLLAFSHCIPVQLMVFRVGVPLQPSLPSYSSQTYTKVFLIKAICAS